MLSKIYVIRLRICRFYSTIITNNENVKKFNSLPGPSGPMKLGTIFKYLPIVGSYSWDELHKVGISMYKTYGPIVRETILPGIHVVWLFDPNDFSKLLNDSVPGIYPHRQSHSALDKYRKDRPDLYKSGGLLPTNGREWWRIRSEFQKGLSSPAHVRSFFPETNEIVNEFVSGIRPTVNGESVPDFLPELSRLNLELVCFLIFDKRMNSFSDEERQKNSLTTKLIDSAEVTNSCVLPLERGLQLWRLFPTPMYRKLCKAQEYMESVAIDLVTKKSNIYDHTVSRSSSRIPLLAEYIQNKNIDRKDIIGMAGDLLLGGIDTTTYTTSFLLYHLAKNPEVQNKLWKEVQQIVPNPTDNISLTSFNNDTKYARAVLKESLRLNPISVGVGRILTHDSVFSGYFVPKGINVVTNNFVSCRLEKNFPEPDKFRPERWLKNQSDYLTKHNPYLVLPFGHGMRACIARRMAEQNILILLIRLIRMYEVGWAGSDFMDVKSILINKPDQPVRITFKLRNQ